MKARDPDTGNFKKIYVKALDSLPVGAEIDIDDNSDIPVGWEETTAPENILMENGLIKMSDFTTNSNVGGGAGRIYNLSFTKTYTNKPTVLVSFVYEQSYSVYGTVTISVANLKNTGCTIFHSITGLTANNAYVAYTVISND